MNTLMHTERRQSRRLPYAGPVQIEAPARNGWISGEGRDLNEGGLSIRLTERLDLHTLVRLRLATGRTRTSVECVGRVAWTTERVDLRPEPPYPYDMGIEFVQVPAFIRRRLSHAYQRLREQRASRPPTRVPTLRGAALNGRYYAPSVTYETTPQPAWHLIVRSEDVPCYARRFTSAAAAVDGWRAFKRECGRTPARPATARPARHRGAVRRRR